jgi:hypothetical protein
MLLEMIAFSMADVVFDPAMSIASLCTSEFLEEIEVFIGKY